MHIIPAIVSQGWLHIMEGVQVYEKTLTIADWYGYLETVLSFILQKHFQVFQFRQDKASRNDIWEKMIGNITSGLLYWERTCIQLFSFFCPWDCAHENINTNGMSGAAETAAYLQSSNIRICIRKQHIQSTQPQPAGQDGVLRRQRHRLCLPVPQR
jgi:hypothetical protein